MQVIKFKNMSKKMIIQIIMNIIQIKINQIPIQTFKKIKIYFLRIKRYFLSVKQERLPPGGFCRLPPVLPRLFCAAFTKNAFFAAE